MTTTPKAVIMAVVIFLGLIVLGVIGATVALQLTGNGALPSDIQNLGLVALGALAGVLATTRTTPELPVGAVLEQGQTTLRGAPSADALSPVTVSGVASADAPSPLVTLADQGIDPALGVAQDFQRNANADPAP